MHHEEPEILLVANRAADVRLFLEVFRQAETAAILRVAHNGNEVQALLGHTDHELPDLILLDVNLGGVGGREVLVGLKQDSAFKHIPVIVFSSSDEDEDVLEVYRSHANCYIVKPADVNQFVDLIRSIDDFWLTLVKLPTRLMRPAKVRGAGTS